MDQAELNRLCNQSGVEGSLWRLIRTWDPGKCPNCGQRHPIGQQCPDYSFDVDNLRVVRSGPFFKKV